MTIIEIIIVVFIFLELSNVVMLYFAPGSKNANAIGVFASWEDSKKYPEIHDFVRYLVNWVAGSKLIFIFLLIGILLIGEREIQQASLIALAVATLSFEIGKKRFGTGPVTSTKEHQIRCFFFSIAL